MQINLVFILSNSNLNLCLKYSHSNTRSITYTKPGVCVGGGLVGGVELCCLLGGLH
jgi:hypothetical protein